MIFENKEYKEQDFEALVNQLLECPDYGEELRTMRAIVRNSNPNLYLFLFRAASKLKEEAKSSDDHHRALALDLLWEQLKVNSNLIPADLPDLILMDNDLINIELADFRGYHMMPKYWQQFQEKIESINKETPKSGELPFLYWCKEMLQRNYAKHKEMCIKPTSCSTNKSYERRIQYIARLIEDATPSQSTTESRSEKPQRNHNRIQWLGTQKELAELFIRLKAKGWISDFETETIKDCFTSANSIQQLLKPGTYTEDLGGTFEQVFTQEYSPKFHGITPNLRRDK